MGEFLNYIFAWYNVWFTAPIAFVFVFALFQLVTGGLDFGSGEADVHLDMEADVDMDVEVDADIDAEGEPEGGGVFAGLLGVLNVGKAPLMVILMSLFAIWGMSGLVMNEALHLGTTPRLGLQPKMALGISLATALVSSIVGTRYLALGISKLLPESEPALTARDLVGLTGRVISGRVTTTFGTVRVRAPNGIELTVSGRVRDGDAVPLKGDSVILVDYNPTTQIFDVVKADDMLNVSEMR